MSNEKLEPEVSETFTLLAPPDRVEVASLPRSPKQLALSVERMGWKLNAWIVLGEFAPTRYASSSEDKGYNSGDVKSEGYVARVYVVDAIHPDLPLGFKALYVGKEYASNRKVVAGAFSHAQVVDPVGIPRELSAEYKPIRYLRGKYETEKSYQSNVKRAQTLADGQGSYNDGALIFQHKLLFQTAREFDSWLAEWASFPSIPPKKANPNV